MLESIDPRYERPVTQRIRKLQDLSFRCKQYGYETTEISAEDLSLLLGELEYLQRLINTHGLRPDTRTPAQIQADGGW